MQVMHATLFTPHMDPVQASQKSLTIWGRTRRVVGILRFVQCLLKTFNFIKYLHKITYNEDTLTTVSSTQWCAYSCVRVCLPQHPWSCWFLRGVCAIQTSQKQSTIYRDGNLYKNSVCYCLKITFFNLTYETMLMYFDFSIA